MKIQKLLLSFALLLVFGASWAGAAPAAIESPAQAEVAVTAVTAVTAAEEAPAKADCTAVNFATPSWLAGQEECGLCSLNPCVGRFVGEGCGEGRTCQAVGLCFPEGTPLCRCRPELQ